MPTFVLGQSRRSKSDKDINAIGHRNISQEPNFYSAKKEKELGEKLAQEVEKSSEFVTDPEITAYVERVAQNVERNSDKHMPITLHLIDSEAVDAYTLPGGHQYITRGLLLHLEGEGELASMLARGIANTALRSNTEIATKGELIQLSTVPLGSPAPVGSPNVAIPLAELKARRDAVFDADFFGMQYLYKSGYDPKCFIDFVQRIGVTLKPAPEAFSVYPPLPKRLEALQKEIAAILPKRDGATVSTPEFQRFKNRLQVIKPEGAASKNPGN
jgi:predicted Zn-dependent protease